MGSVAISAVSVDVLLYISVAIKASFLKPNMCNICKNNIAKMFLDFFTSRPFLKTAGGIVLGSIAVSAVSAVSPDVLLYISVAIKASFLKLGMCNICKNNIAKMFLDFF